jgi:Protein of unknown function (DUF4232)
LALPRKVLETNMKPARRGPRVAGLVLALAALTVALSVGSAGADTQVRAAAACEVNNQRLTFFPAAEGAAGSLIDKFRYKIRRGSGQPARCSLRGYPKVQLLGRRGRVLPVRVRRAPGRVRTVSLRRGKPVRFSLLRRNPETANCETRRVYRISVMVPGQAKAMIIKGFDPIRFCRAGTRVTPLSRNGGS